MVAWHHQLDGNEFEQAPGVGDGQGNLACCSPWIAKSHTQLNWTELSVLPLSRCSGLALASYEESNLFLSCGSEHPLLCTAALWALLHSVIYCLGLVCAPASKSKPCQIYLCILHNMWIFSLLFWSFLCVFMFFMPCTSLMCCRHQ